MASPLYQQIEHVETLVAALTPVTDASDAFVLSGTDLTIPNEPDHRPRIFTVYPDPGAPLTQERFGTSHRQALGRFVVDVLLDSRADERARDQRLVEDRDQIIGALEAPGARATANVQRVSCVDARIEQGTSDHATRLVLVFECLYVQAL